jgi:hypothetical protein
MSQHYNSDPRSGGELLDTAIINSFRDQIDILNGRYRFGGMTAVVLDPYHAHAHPMIVRLPYGPES